jgi:hypothetical protein
VQFEAPYPVATLGAYHGRPAVWSMSSPTLRDLLVMLLLVGTPILSSVYAGLETYGREMPTRDGALSDTLDYLDVYAGRQDPLTGHAPLYTRADRIGVPYLARLVPAPPAAVFTAGRPNSETFNVAARFAVLNGLFVYGTTVVLYALTRGFGQPPTVAVLAGLLFTGLTFVVYDAGFPMVDAGALFCLGLGALAVQRRSVLSLLVIAMVGMLIKETMLVVLVYVGLSPYPWRRRLHLAAAVLPGAALYLWLRFVAAPSTNDYVASGRILTDHLNRVIDLLTAHSVASIFLTYGLLWIPFVYALARCNVPAMLRLWAYAAPIILLMIAAWGTESYSRLLLNSYPAVVPLAALGLRELWGRTDRAAAPT